MKALTVLNNFSIMAQVRDSNYMSNLLRILNAYCIMEVNAEHVDVYRITPDSFWDGMNEAPEYDFIQILKDNTDEDLPNSVLSDLEKFKSRFGLITLVGDDCLKVSDEDILTEIKNNTKLNEIIYNYEDNLIFFSGDIREFASILSSDLFCPIRYHVCKMFSFFIQDADFRYFVKAPNYLLALRYLYGTHNKINEEYLRKELGYKKQQVTEEALKEFLNRTLAYLVEQKLIICVPEKTRKKPIRLLY